MKEYHLRMRQDLERRLQQLLNDKESENRHLMMQKDIAKKHAKDM